MASISSPGVGSGIDIGGLVTRLVEAESEPATLRIEAGEVEAREERTWEALKSAAMVTGIVALGGFAVYQAARARTEIKRGSRL